MSNYQGLTMPLAVVEWKECPMCHQMRKTERPLTKEEQMEYVGNAPCNKSVAAQLTAMGG